MRAVGEFRGQGREGDHGGGGQPDAEALADRVFGGARHQGQHRAAVTLTTQVGTSPPSIKSFVVDTLPPPAPQVATSNGQFINGTAEPGTTVTLKDGQGNLIGTVGPVGADGNWTLIPKQILPDGTVLNATSADAIAVAARSISDTLNLSAIVCYTGSGSTGLRVVRERPPTPVIALTPIPATARRLALAWGLHCVLTDDARDLDDMVARACRIAFDEGFAQPGQRIIITAGVPPTPCRSSITYAPLGLKSANIGTRLLTACMSSSVSGIPTARAIAMISGASAVASISAIVQIAVRRPVLLRMTPT